MAMETRPAVVLETVTKKTRRSSGPRATEMDAFVGRQLRTARKLAKVTQQELAVVLGVSFQAVQKYENGENRITAPRLFKAAEFLGADIRFFTTPGYEAGQPPLDRTTLADDEIELLRYYRGLTNQRARTHLRKLVQAMGEPDTVADWPEQEDTED